MFHDILQAYADAMYVATTLRPPRSAPVRYGDECPANSGDRRRTPLWVRLGRWFSASLRAQLASDAVRRPFLRTPHP